MALIPCPECGKQVSEDARRCPECGGWVALRFAKKTFNPIVTVLLLISLALFVATR